MLKEPMVLTMNNQDNTFLADLLNIPHEAETLRTRGGYFSPRRNVWIAKELSDCLKNSTPERLRLMDAFAGMALVAGQIHRTQLKDNNEGRVWPSQWISNRNGKELVAFFRSKSLVPDPYLCVTDRLETIPYSTAYHELLMKFCAQVNEALQSGDEAVEAQHAYLNALIDAFCPGSPRTSDLDAMANLDVAWLKTPASTPLLLLSEFTESYSDPLKQAIQDQPEVIAWASEVSQRTGLGPWKVFFEMRVFDQGGEELSYHEVEAIRATSRELYSGISAQSASENALTEFRRVLIVAGHGANPPKNAKNYPNQAWIREQHGYRNILFANQMAENVKLEIVPSLRAAFKTDWANMNGSFKLANRARSLLVIGHEENHPWLCFPEVTWVEEFKSTILGLWAVANANEVQNDLGNVMALHVGVILFSHRYNTYLLARGDKQMNDYYIGDTILLNQLHRNNYFMRDEEGKVVDIQFQHGKTAIESLVQRLVKIRTGQDTIQALYNDLYDTDIYNLFRGWEEQQHYFENLWSG
jgi:hypothetical protein